VDGGGGGEHAGSVRSEKTARLTDVIDWSVSLVKARLYLSPTLFIQIYRNDRCDTTNRVLIYHGQ
jgi:hypothetical protein